MGKMYKTFKTDQGLETKGFWLDLGDFRIRLARAGGSNKAYQKAMATATAPHRKALAAEMMDDDVAMNILHKVYADTIVLEWEAKNAEGELVPGIESPDGSVQPFNRENVITTFRNLPELFSMVQENTNKSSMFRASLLEEAAKN